MLKQRFAVFGVIAAVVFGLGLLIGALLHHLTSFGPRPVTYNTATVIRQVQTLSQLVTVKYVMEKVEILEDPPQSMWRQFLPDNTRVILVAHGIVKAGVDLGKIEPGDVRVSGTRIKIRIPPAQITDAYLDDQKTQVIEHTTGFLRSFNKNLEQTTRQNAIDDIRRAARSNGIIKDADERARAQLTVLFHHLGFTEIDVETR